MVLLSLWILFAYCALTNAHRDSSESNESEELIHRYYEYSDIIAQLQGQNGYPTMLYPHPQYNPHSYPPLYPHPNPHRHPYPAEHNPHVYNHPAYPLPNPPRGLHPQQISMSTLYPNYSVQPNYGGSPYGPIKYGTSKHGQPQIPASFGYGLYRREQPLPVYGTPPAGYAYPNFATQPIYPGSPYGPTGQDPPHMPIASGYESHGVHYPTVGMYGGQVPISEMYAGQQPITNVNRGQQPVSQLDTIATQRPLPENPTFQEKEDQPSSSTSTSNPRTEDEDLMNQPKLLEIDLRSDTGENNSTIQPKHTEFVYETVNIDGLRKP